MTKNIDCDVVVVGGGPGGATIATMLAREGADVVVLEGKKFPRHHLGESLLAVSMPILEELGVSEVLSRQDFPRKRGAVFLWGPEREKIGLIMPRPGYAYQVQRHIFDSLLLDHAEHSGARVLQEHWARDVVWNEEGRMTGVVAQEAGQEPFIIQARYVVDASGLFQFLPRKLGLQENLYGPKRVALSGYWEGALRPDPPHADDVITEACEDGWLWFIPLSPTLTSVGFVGDEDDVGRDANDFLLRQVKSSKLVRRMTEGARLTRRARVLKYRNHAIRSAWWERGYVLVGDSAAFVDPLFSTGVHATLFSAVAAGAAISTTLAGRISEDEAARWYDHRARNHYAKTTEMIRLLYGLHPGVSRFWRSRWLGGIDEEAAERIVAGMGVEGMDFFAGTRSAGTLPFPDPVRRKIHEFKCRPKPSDVALDPPLAYARHVQRSSDWMRQGSILVRCTKLHHLHNRTHEIYSPVGSPLERVLRSVDGRRSLGELMRAAEIPAEQAASLRRAVGTLVDGGLLDLASAGASGHGGA
ncbi:NAD(P)/FAD-dependent oxidoreductase [Nonomuraea sp. NPDC049141]|uniref:NAD(P)/FAD-dependent oxidoreductase n=1 Tax=Nonomuraea sp. NPDC049141 TaxID=3155500 RepID=UPI003410DB5E